MVIGVHPNGSTKFLPLHYMAFSCETKFGSRLILVNVFGLEILLLKKISLASVHLKRVPTVIITDH